MIAVIKKVVTRPRNCTQKLSFASLEVGCQKINKICPQSIFMIVIKTDDQSSVLSYSLHIVTCQNEHFLKRFTQKFFPRLVLVPETKISFPPLQKKLRIMNLLTDFRPIKHLVNKSNHINVYESCQPATEDHMFFYSGFYCKYLYSLPIAPLPLLWPSFLCKMLFQEFNYSEIWNRERSESL